MLIREWPKEAREAMEEIESLDSEIIQIHSEIVKSEDPSAKRTLVDKFYLLRVRMNFNLGKSLNLLKESLEDMSLRRGYRKRLIKDVAWLQGIYSSDSQAIKGFYYSMQESRRANATGD